MKKRIIILALLSVLMTLAYAAESVKMHHFYVHRYNQLDSVRVDGYFATGPREVADKINDAIVKATVGYHGDFKQSFVYHCDSAYAELKHTSDDCDMVFYSTIDMKIIYETDKYVTLEINFYDYEGGAHGIDGITGITFNKIDGSQVTYETLGLNKTKANRAKRAQVFRILKKELSYPKGLTGFPEAEPYLTDKGVHFQYEPYEIGPYAMGAPSVDISYSRLKTILGPVF